MRVLVTGGAASGKSAWAEQCCAQLGGSLLYVATMRPYGEEGQRRVERHRALRAHHGFDTLECYDSLDKAHLNGAYHTVLLECLGNLCANEMFDAPQKTADAAAAVVRGVGCLSEQCSNLVTVSNEVFSGAERYRDEMERYLTALGEINQRLADMFDVVVECVCGLPVIWKGRELLPWIS